MATFVKLDFPDIYIIKIVSFFFFNFQQLNNNIG